MRKNLPLLLLLLLTTQFFLGPGSAHNVHADVFNDIEDPVDNDTSDVDSSPDEGTHGNFENQKAYDSTYDTLQEEDPDGGPSNSSAFIDGFENQNFNLWDEHVATGWQIGTTGSGTGGSMDPHTGSYDAWADETNEGQLVSDSINLTGASNAYYSIWYAGDDLEDNDLTIEFYNGSWYTMRAREVTFRLLHHLHGLRAHPQSLRPDHEAERY